MKKTLLITALLSTLFSCSNDDELSNSTSECSELDKIKIVTNNKSTTTCEAKYEFNSDSFSNLKYDWYINNKRIDNSTENTSTLSYTFTENGTYEICMKPIVTNGTCTLQKKCITLDIEDLKIGTVKDIQDYLVGLDGPMNPVLKGNELYFSESIRSFNRISKIDITEATPTIKEVVLIPKSATLFEVPLISALVFKDNILYAAESRNGNNLGNIYKIDVTADSPKAESIAKFLKPTDLAFKGNDLYVADLGNSTNSDQSTIYKIDVTSSEIKKEVVIKPTLAPISIAFKGDELFMILRPNRFSGGQISKINVTKNSPQLTDIATGLNLPRKITFIGNDLYLFDYSLKEILRVDTGSGAMTSIISNGPDNFQNFIFTNGAVFLTSYTKRKIQKITLNCSEL
ncbi:hypothetical protein [uncultured Tenacibaculum sp.]|uniref:hypothetical protein n=1 Tax=uncultured Tenacibaculum sp. TaxID=174713 RepID=UPI002603ED8C|nr:hypothetical protein [uncultured Tenacibaculum sp.]